MVIPPASASVPYPPRTGVAAPPANASAYTAAAFAAAAKNQASAAMDNKFRLRTVVERLQLHFNGGITLGTSDLFHLIFALARGIDYLLSINDIPGISNRLPSLVKQVCLLQKEPLLKSAVMVLMISAKNACQNRWFQTSDADELLSISNELHSNFCLSVGDTVSNPQDIISKIMVRFYPQLKFCRLVVSFEAKPGYDILMADFHIPRNISLLERICLLVIQTDNLETSSSIISPQQVSFLVNGKGVERRTNVSMDTGPQFPTDITRMLKYGTNIIQAVGYFSGNYMIAIAFMSKITPPCVPRLEDYVHPLVEKHVSDLDIIEGPSRITLLCPISFKRINTPVKGHLCKHHQSFDYDNFMEMNSRKPSWRCPCCHTPTSFIDLRIDQKMAKILLEVEENVSDIVIFADGSWKTFAEHNESISQVHKWRSKQKETNMENDKRALADVVDLTMEEDGTSDIAKSPEEAAVFHRFVDKTISGSSELEDRKPFMVNEILPIPLYATGAPVAGGSMSTQAATRSMSERSGGANALGTLENRMNNVFLNPSQTDSVSPALHRIPTATDLSQRAISLMLQLSQNMHMQSSSGGGSFIRNEARRSPSPRHVSRPSSAVQALPAQTQLQSSSRMMQSVMSNVLSSVSDEVQNDQHPRSSNIPSASLPLHSIIQEYHRPSDSVMQPLVALRTANLIGNRAPQGQLRGTGGYRPTFSPSSFNQIVYQRRHHSANPTNVSQAQPSHFPASQVHQASSSRTVPLPSRHVVQGASQQSAAAVLASSRMASVPTPAETGALPELRSDGLPELPYDANWRPTGRMRGSLTGGAYEAALNQYLVSPSQPTITQPPPFSVIPSTDQLPALNTSSLDASIPLTQQLNMGHSDADNFLTSSNRMVEDNNM